MAKTVFDFAVECKILSFCKTFEGVMILIEYTRCNRRALMRRAIMIAKEPRQIKLLLLKTKDARIRSRCQQKLRQINSRGKK